MDEFDHRIEIAFRQTRVLRPPKQHLATFGATDLRYYLVTTPSYSDVLPGGEESVIREGKVLSQRPTIVTPTYMLSLEGFGNDARQYMESMVRQYGPNSPGLLYQYRNEPGDLEIVGGEANVVARRIADDLDQRGVGAAAVIVGTDDLWDLSLMKFIYDYTTASLSANVDEIQAMGLLDPHPDVEVPRGAVQRIESLFRQAERGSDPQDLHQELSRWGLFEHYQDRFLSLFRRK
jgi:hypothetical protein